MGWREPGLYGVTSSTSLGEMIELASRLDIDLSAHAAAGPDPVRVTVEALDAKGLGVVYRFGADHILLVALNGEGDLPGAWGQLHRRWDEATQGDGRSPRAVGTMRFVTGDRPALPDMTSVGWGWISGDLENGVAVARLDKEDIAHRFLSGRWPVAWEIARRAEQSRASADEARARLDRADADRSLIGEVSDDLRLAAANLGRLISPDDEVATRFLLTQRWREWNEARRRWTKDEPISRKGLRERLPFPVAAALRTWERSWPPERKFRKALDAAEAAVAVPALVGTAVLANQGVPFGGPHWERPAYSCWPELISRFQTGVAPRPGPPLLAAEVWRTVANAYAPIVAIRNRHHGHGAVREDESFYEDLCEQLEDLVGALLVALGALGPIELAVLRSVERRRGCVVRARVAHAMGSNPHFLESWVKFRRADDLWDGDVILLDDEGPLGLHPFFCLIESGGPPTVACLSGVSLGRARYLCRASGQQEQNGLEPRVAQAFDIGR